MSGTDINEAANNLLQTLKENYINYLSRMEGGEYHFERIALLKYKLHKISLRRAGSYIDSPSWIKNKKATINPQNTKDNYCFIYAVTIALNHQEINHQPERTPKLIPFIPKYNWGDVYFPAKSKDWEKF